MNGVGWLTVEAARDAMTEATGVTWRIGSRSNGVLCGSSVLYCGKQKSTGCRAKICLQTGRHDAGVYRVNARKTDLTHTGHDTVVVAAANGKRPHEEPAVEEEEEESSHFRGKRSKLQNVFLEEVQYDDDDDEGDDEYDEDGPVEQPEDDSARALRDSVAHLDCEQIRRLFPKDMTGLTALAYENPEYDLKKRGCVTECRRSVFKRVTTIGSADVFKQALRECERPYFEWWSMFNGEGDDLSPLVYLRVHGVSSLEVERSLMRMQERYACLTRSDFSSSGHTRHAVFTCPLDPSHSALLAINVHALRSYRMLSVNFLAVESAMPLAPVLIQFWGMKPTCAAEVSQRQYGIMTTLLFIERVIGRSAQATTFERHGYAITEPGFEIYDYLPEFLAMFHGSEQLLRAHLFEALHMESVYEAADAESPGPSNLCGMIAAFLFQKRPHFVSYQFIADLHKLFHDSNVGFQLKERCPEAWRVINVTYSKRQKPVWVLLDLDPHRKRKSAAKRGEGPLEMPPAYYLYRLALIDGRGLLTDLQRLNICKGMRLMETRQPASSSVTSLLYADAQALEYYHQALARPSSDPIQSRLTQYSLNSRDLWPLDSLFIVLRALDYHRQRAAVPRQSWTDDFEPPTEYSVVDGPLNIQDCTDYFVRYLNLPVAHMNAGGHNRDRESPSLAYLDDTLWVWGSGLKGPHTALMEAELLIRDPAFYLVD